MLATGPGSPQPASSIGELALPGAASLPLPLALAGTGWRDLRATLARLEAAATRCLPAPFLPPLLEQARAGLRLMPLSSAAPF